MKDGGNKKGGEVWNEKRRLVIVKNVREGVNVKRKARRMVGGRI